MNAPNPHLAGVIEAPMKLSTAPYISPEYARAEKEKLWLKVWQVACREEEIPNVGDFYTYDILDQSVIVVRTGEDEIVAYHNACRHRGRRLTRGCGKATHFHCPYHGWQWSLAGDNTRVLDREDWSGALDDARIRLRGVKSARWGGFVFVNFDPDCEPLEDFLQKVPYWIGPFQPERMRYKWRQWLRMDCNWKVAVEAFIEGYHAETTHPQTRQFSEHRHPQQFRGPAWAPVSGQRGWRRDRHRHWREDESRCPAGAVHWPEDAEGNRLDPDHGYIHRGGTPHT